MAAPPTGGDLRHRRLGPGAGKPVVALRVGGALETVADGAKRVLFGAQLSIRFIATIERSDSVP